MADFYISSANLIKNFLIVYTPACGGGASDEVFSTAFLRIVIESFVFLKLGKNMNLPLFYETKSNVCKNYENAKMGFS